MTSGTEPRGVPGPHGILRRSGIFDGHCGTDLDDGVAAVGYGTSKGHCGIDPEK
ncbi:hypothetical protein Tco_0126311, partial [Tanacetum coccineum]